MGSGTFGQVKLFFGHGGPWFEISIDCAEWEENTRNQPILGVKQSNCVGGSDCRACSGGCMQRGESLSYHIPRMPSFRAHDWTGNILAHEACLLTHIFPG